MSEIADKLEAAYQKYPHLVRHWAAWGVARVDGRWQRMRDCTICILGAVLLDQPVTPEEQALDPVGADGVGAPHVLASARILGITPDQAVRIFKGFDNYEQPQGRDEEFYDAGWAIGRRLFLAREQESQ